LYSFTYFACILTYFLTYSLQVEVKKFSHAKSTCLRQLWTFKIISKTHCNSAIQFSQRIATEQHASVGIQQNICHMPYVSREIHTRQCCCTGLYNFPL